MLQTIERILTGVSGIIGLLCSALSILLVLRAVCYSRKRPTAWETLSLGRKLITWLIGSSLYYIVLALFFMFLALVFFGYAEKDDKNAKPTDITTNYNNSSTVNDSLQSEQTHVLPLLLDLGSDWCKPCKMMIPILEELKKEYSSVFRVQFIDVGKDNETAKKYNVRVIPVQIFFDADGKELFRHEGFFPKEEILATWNELGVDVYKTEDSQ